MGVAATDKSAPFHIRFPGAVAGPALASMPARAAIPPLAFDAAYVAGTRDISLAA